MNTLIQKFIFFFQLAFPARKIEWCIFIVYLLIFCSSGYFIAQKYTIIFDQRIPWDAYFSFDNRAIVLTGGGFERHPLANYFFEYIRAFSLWVSSGKYDASFRFSLAVFSSFAMAFSILYVFKYLCYIIKLEYNIALLLSVFFSLFSTTLLLSFTPETYTYTQPLLLLFLLYASQQIQKKRPLSSLAMILGAMSIGGLTITNTAKVFLPTLFEHQLYKRTRNLLFAFGKISLSIFALLGLFLYRMDFNYQQILHKTETQYEKFSQPKITPIWDMIASWFWGGNMLFPSFIMRDYHSKEGFQYKALFMDTYSSFASYIWVILIFLGIIWAVLKQRKNTLIYILLSFGAVDTIIHIVLKFGLHTAYIYGGHYIFLVPLFLGWLLSSYSSASRYRIIIVCTLIVMMTFLFMNNLYRIQEFWDFIERYYKVS